MQVISDNLMYSATCFYASQGGGESGGGMSGVFPSEPITADSENYFWYQGGETEQFMAYEGDVAYMGEYEDSYLVLDQDNYTMKNNTYIWIKFKEPTKIKTFSTKVGSTGWRLYATNVEGAFRNTIGNYHNWSEVDGKFLVASGEETGGELKDFSVNPEGTAYQYYTFVTSGTWAYIYEIALKTE